MACSCCGIWESTGSLRQKDCRDSVSRELSKSISQQPLAATFTKGARQGENSRTRVVAGCSTVLTVAAADGFSAASFCFSLCSCLPGRRPGSHHRGLQGPGLPASLQSILVNEDVHRPGSEHYIYDEAVVNSRSGCEPLSSALSQSSRRLPECPSDRRSRRRSTTPQLQRLCYLHPALRLWHR